METAGNHRTSWRRSTACVNKECVEVALTEGQVVVRNSKRPATRILFTQTTWKRFTSSVHITINNEAISARENSV